MTRLSLVLTSVLYILQSGVALPIRRDSLDNGLVVLTYRESRLPIASLAFVCRSGAAHDPEGKAGTADLTATLLTTGTPGISADSVASIVEFLGAQFSGGAEHDRSLIQLQLLSKDLDQGLDLLASAVLRPAFAPAELKLALDQSIAAARRRNDQPRAVVAREFARLVFGSHPYARPASGDTSSLRAVRHHDIIRFHKTHYLPNNSFIVAVGDIDPDALLGAVSARFAGWVPGKTSALSAPDLPAPTGAKVKLIMRPEMNQTYVEFGHPGISIHDRDLVPARLMSYILGGSALSSRFGISVRERAGLAYDVRCWFDRMDLTGAFHASVQTAHPNKAAELMLADIRRMRDSGATAQELLKAHNYFTGSFPLSYSSNRGKLQQLIHQETYRLGDDWLERFPDEVRAVTLEDINRAAARRLSPDAYWMVIMGPVTRDDITLPGADLLD